MTGRDPLSLNGQLIADKYEVEGLVGEGGFAVVYRARHVIWDKPVAIKFFSALSSAPADEREELQRAFVQEGALLSELSSATAGIVQARDVGATVTPLGTWTPYLVLEWLDGVGLDRVLTEDRRLGHAWSLEDTLGFLSRILPPLHVAHQRGVVHRDIKPANIFVLGNAARSLTTPLKLLDFGVAKLVTENTHVKAALAKTGIGISSFTPQYGAPEQFARSYGATGPWTDVYAMALVAVELLTCRGALEGDDLVQLGFSTGNPNARPTPRARGAVISDALEAVFARALAVHPEDRFPNAGAFLEALQAAHGTRLSPSNWPQLSVPPPALETASTVLVPSLELQAPRVPQFFAASVPPPPPSSAAPASAVASAPAISAPAISAPAISAAATSAPATAGAAKPRASSGVFTSILAALALLGLGTAVYAVSDLKGAKETKEALLEVAATAKSVASDLKPKPAATAEPSKGPEAAPSSTLAAEPTPEASAVVDTNAALSSVTSGAAAPTAAPTASSADSAAAPATGKCPEGMLWMAGGRFTMGSGAVTDDNDAAPAHPVTLDPYCIDLREVAAKDYQACVDARRCKPARSVAMPNLGASERRLYSSLCTQGRKDKEEYPVNCVTWRQADRYCRSVQKRLPSEAEWELAALGAVPRAYPWGDEEPTLRHTNACNGECVAWAKEQGLTWPGLAAGDDGYPTLAPVGQFPRGNTESGLQDLAGNVAEWVEDGYAPYPESAVENPRGMPRADRRVVRGGAWNSSYARAFRPFVRRAEPFTRATAEIGFRCASDPLP